MTSYFESVWTRNRLPEATLLNNSLPYYKNNNSTWWSLHWSLSHCSLNYYCCCFQCFIFPRPCRFLQMICFLNCLALMSWDFKVQTKCRVMVNAFHGRNGAFTYLNDLVYIRKWASRERARHVKITYQTLNPRPWTTVLSTLSAITPCIVDRRRNLLSCPTH